jgi:translation initiation factor IF-3
MFRGREMAHPERGEQLLNRLAEELGELAVVEQRPQQDGRNMVMMLAPSRSAGEDDAAAAAAAEEAAAAAKPRKAPQQKAPGSAEPVEINPEQI